ncbi:histidine--tRNA ligase [Schlesneria sp. T3-172]|uniref:histidine--tRNA ligase n=1 Tax=Schlesneria sphaerica TaxID=3373610 RepID=UPI0037C9C8E3
MSQLIEPRTLRGFRDFLPEVMLVRERLMETARRVFRSYGFSPIDTPALEYAEILTGKGGEESDKQLFRFKDGGDRDVAMRFDLTVPLARFAAQHSSTLGTPFKRYHIAPVWRGENTQRGRYREFVQCDFDTIGTDSNAADIETLLVIHDLLVALGFERFTIRVNNRLILNGVLAALGLTDKTVGVLRAIDKLPKIGQDNVIAEMVEKVGTTPDQAKQVLLTVGPQTDLAFLATTYADNEQVMQGVKRLRQLFDAAATAGIPQDRMALDVSIARGLDYYTGTIYETFLTDLPSIGSICSGGRYDNLAGLFTKERLPGVGASLGLDRLIAAMEELKLLGTQTTPAPVLITQFDDERLGDYLRVARLLRAAGISTEVYPETKKLGKQLQYADKKGFRVALIAGSDEFAKGVWQIKDLKAGTSTTVEEGNLIASLQSILSAT